MFDPFQEIRQMRKEMNRMFRDFFEKPEKELIGTGKSLSEFNHPLSDIQETENDVIVTLDMPSIDKKDINITIKDYLLELEAERKSGNKNREKWSLSI